MCVAMSLPRCPNRNPRPTVPGSAHSVSSAMSESIGNRNKLREMREPGFTKNTRTPIPDLLDAQLYAGEHAIETDRNFFSSRLVFP